VLGEGRSHQSSPPAPKQSGRGVQRRAASRIPHLSGGEVFAKRKPQLQEKGGGREKPEENRRGRRRERKINRRGFLNTSHMRKSVLWGTKKQIINPKTQNTPPDHNQTQPQKAGRGTLFLTDNSAEKESRGGLEEKGPSCSRTLLKKQRIRLKGGTKGRKCRKIYAPGLKMQDVRKEEEISTTQHYVGKKKEGGA